MVTANNKLTALGVVKRLLVWHWKLHLASALALAVAIASVIAAMLMGWSIEGSLRQYMVSRLAGVQSIVSPTTLVDGSHLPPDAAGLLELRATVSSDERQGVVVPVRLWSTIGRAPSGWNVPETGPDEVIVNAAVLGDLGVPAGTTVTLRVDIAPLKLLSDALGGRARG